MDPTTGMLIPTALPVQSAAGPSDLQYQHPGLFLNANPLAHQAFAHPVDPSGTTPLPPMSAHPMATMAKPEAAGHSADQPSSAPQPMTTSPAGAGAPNDGSAAADPSQQQQDANDPEAVAAALVARMGTAGASIIFEKSLTASDVSGGGRVVVPKSVAEQYFPRLEQPSGVTISAADLDGRTYTFKWRFWVNNSSRMYLLEGAGELHRNYGLEVGDVMVFGQKPDGSLVVAGRVANKSDLIRKPPIKRPAGHGSVGAGAGAGAAARGREARTARAAPRLPAGGVPPGVAESAAGAAGLAVGAGVGGRAVGAAGAAAAAPPPLGDSAAAAAVAARGRKRKVAVPASTPGDSRFRSRSEEGFSLAVLDMEAPSDGIFRALVVQQPTPVSLGVALARNNRWTATLDVAGELYQAFFDSRDDAVEALTAAGSSP